MKSEPPTFGYVMPSSSGDRVPETEAIWKLAKFADSSSELSHLWVSDHLVWWLPMYESLTMLAALAALTKRIRIGTAVLQIAMRSPLIVAKQLATIDRLSSGRLTVGLGVGGEFPPEWKAAGVSRSTRGRRTDEMIDALRGLWSEGPFSFTGNHVHLDDVDLQPKPADRLPIWVGGRTDASIQRAALRGDGWMGIFLTPERYRESIAKIEQECRSNGREPGELARSLYIWTSVAKSEREARSRAEALVGGFYNLPFDRLERYVIMGTPEQCARRFREFADAGCRDFAIAPITADAGPELIEMLVKEVIPAVG